ncbi:MAG TPA: NUDIX domain-containing protein [Patescibacteria group bacterium]|jgi:8-oxo-dGTP pyrophosphatase MutT (NUDIX family)|nr:NUDIX domain-containing protein [Patescibacteria group bacterium]
MQEARRVCVRGLIYENGKLFGQKLHKSSGDWWCTPGGGVDPMESLHDALTREMIEETGVTPVIGRLVFVQQFATKGSTSHGEDEQLEFFFLIENPDDYKDINLESTTHGTLEIAEFGFIDPTEKNMLPAILQTPEITDALAEQRPVIFYTQFS